MDTEKDLALDASRLLQLFMPWTPTVGGASEIVDQPMHLFRAGKARDMPMLIGTVQDECLMFVLEAFTSKISPGEYTLLMEGKICI